MSKQILKIERQPWMPEWATHWALDVDIDGQITEDGLYQWSDGELGFFTLGNYHGAIFPDVKALLDNWHYVYEITEPRHDSN